MTNERDRTPREAQHGHMPPADRPTGPLYRVTSDPDWLRETLTSADHLFVKAPDRSMTCIKHGCPAAECVPPLTDSCVWRRTLDEGLYTATVTRVASHRGLFTLSREGGIVLQQHVGLMYNAEFGPDAEDIELWESIGIAAADNDYRRRGETPPDAI